MSRTLELTVDLMGRASVTPADEGCQNVMMSRLAALGFEVEMSGGVPSGKPTPVAHLADRSKLEAALAAQRSGLGRIPAAVMPARPARR